MEYLVPMHKSNKFNNDTRKYNYIQLLLKPYDSLTKRDLVNLIYQCSLIKGGVDREIRNYKKNQLYEIYESLRNTSEEKKLLREYKLNKLAIN